MKYGLDDIFQEHYSFYPNINIKREVIKERAKSQVFLSHLYVYSELKPTRRRLQSFLCADISEGQILNLG